MSKEQYTTNLPDQRQTDGTYQVSGTGEGAIRYVPLDDGGDKGPGLTSNKPALMLDQFIAAQDIQFESAHEFARAQASQFLDQHLLEGVDPDQLLITTLYILREAPSPAPATIAYSMTLTDALVHNWQQTGSGHFYDVLGWLSPYKIDGYPVRISRTPINLGRCFAYEAIYHKTTPQRFDASTHVSIDPKTFKRFSWDADLQGQYLNELKRFWLKHETGYNLLLKAALLKSAYVQHEEGSLAAEDKALILRAIGLPADQVWEELTLKAFRDAPLDHTLTIRELVLYRYVATDIMVIKDEPTDRLVVYIPGNSSPLHAFKDVHALRDWIAQQCKDPRKRKSLESHFKLADDADGVFLSGLKTALAGFAAYPHRLDDTTGLWRLTEISLGNALSPWPFSHFTHNLQSRLASDARYSISSRADYNKEVAAQVLSNAIAATGAIAMVVPELWLPLAAMSLALTGLGVDEVLEGRTTQERQTGLGRIVFGVLNAVPALVEGAAAGEAVVGAAASGAREVTPGAADEVGQMIKGQSTEHQQAALKEQAAADADVHADRLERAGETPAQRDARLQEEEQQRLALKAQREGGDPDYPGFGIEPSGLRSLTPNLRTALARFEYKAPLPDGAWHVSDAAAIYVIQSKETELTFFVQIYSKMYPVEWVEAAGQYRIISPANKLIKGPYVKQLKGNFSDLDLRPGLRGGDSYSEPSPVSEPARVVEKTDIVLTRAQPPVQIEIPMDGIESRLVADEYGEQSQKYFSLDKPGGTNVFYDADIACWRTNTTHELLWLDNKGRWVRGSEKRYRAIREDLRYGIRNQVYTFPRLPGMPANPEPIEHMVHQVWLGRKLPGTRLLDIMKANMRTSPELKFTLHIDIDDVATVGELTPGQQLQAEFADFPGVTVSDLKSEEFFDGFLQGEDSAEPFAFFRRGEGENLAAASDVLRYRLIREYGGIYLDCDDVLMDSLDNMKLNAGPHDVLVGQPVKSETLSFYGPNSSHFASHRGNPVLREIEREMGARFKSQVGSLRALKAARRDSAAGPSPYMTRISEVTGPGLFFDVIKDTRPDYAGLLDRQYLPGTNVFSLIYAERLQQTEDFYAPFARLWRIRAGSENSWKTTPAA